MKRLPLFALLFAFAACKADVAGPTPYDPQFAAGGQPGAQVVATVTGHFDRDVTELLSGLTRHQKVSLGTQLLSDGSAQGRIRFFRQTVRGTFFESRVEEVSCMVIDGNTAWIGVTTVVANDNAQLGREGVWQFVDGGVGADLAQRNGTFAAAECITKPPLGLVPITHGEIRIHDRR